MSRRIGAKRFCRSLMSVTQFGEQPLEFDAFFGSEEFAHALQYEARRGRSLDRNRYTTIRLAHHPLPWRRAIPAVKAYSRLGGVPRPRPLRKADAAIGRPLWPPGVLLKGGRFLFPHRRDETHRLEGDKMTKVTEDQFEIYGPIVRHVPTGARFTVGSDIVNWGRAGDVLPSGEEFEREDVQRMAFKIMRKIADRSG